MRDSSTSSPPQEGLRGPRNPPPVNVTQEAVREAVYGAVADINEGLPEERRVPLAGSTDIFAALDSLGALNLMLRIEQRLGQVTGAACDLMETDLYETALFSSPTLDQLALAVHGSVNAAP